jgi:hypothetical protein
MPRLLTNVVLVTGQVATEKQAFAPLIKGERGI